MLSRSLIYTEATQKEMRKIAVHKIKLKAKEKKLISCQKYLHTFSVRQNYFHNAISSLVFGLQRQVAVRLL